MSENALGKYLKSLRKSFQYTQEFVASQLNISRQAYSHYETGRVVPPNDICIQLASIYHINTNDLLKLAISSSDPLDNTDTSDLFFSDELGDYINFIENESNSRRLRFLTTQEKKLIYYFYYLSEPDKEDILDFLRIKYRRIMKKKTN